MIPFSVLDLSPICADGTARDALANTLDLARHAERLGYERYWLAEHHNMPGIASAATAVVIGHVAGGTSRIRVGAGGIMLPNHAPLVIAEQFGTLESLYPGRIDLGLGRAPGTDQRAARALRRNLTDSADTFPQDVVELLDYFHGQADGPDSVKAVPGQGLNIPVWLLGSSMFSAQLAAALGLPFAFASHFAPDYLEAALQMYRARFTPSRWLDRPYAMAGLNVFAAETDDEARLLFTSIQQQFINLRRGMPGKLNRPSHEAVSRWSPVERAGADHALSLAVVGSADTVEQGIRRFIDRTGIDELMVTAQIFDHAARVRSFEIVASVRNRLA
ncbi:LLM class flavin-dependent oxidoreductase [Uliginosibacterium sp. sgz301328]|uniref:LLM class flavin-dependent oxidoreductase n=1 Tax=Uliginosibacterium sp. sgz301328 TaxID=3243764 RepID=UPI00359CBE97